eukprot:s1340_g6.t1
MLFGVFGLKYIKMGRDTVFIWEESRLKSNGWQSTWVISMGIKKNRVASRQKKEDIDQLLKLCQEHEGETLEQLKALCISRKEIRPQEPAPMDLDSLFEEASGETAERQVVETPTESQPKPPPEVRCEPEADSIVAASPESQPVQQQQQHSSAPDNEASADLKECHTPAKKAEPVPPSAVAEQDGERRLETPPKDSKPAASTGNPQGEEASADSAASASRPSSGARPFEKAIWGSPKRKKQKLQSGDKKNRQGKSFWDHSRKVGRLPSV